MINSQNERIEIQTITSGEFAGQKILMLFDDPPSEAIGIHLLDLETRNWLIKELNLIEKEK